MLVVHFKTLHQQQQQEKKAFSLKVTLSQAETISGEDAEKCVFFVAVILPFFSHHRILRAVASGMATSDSPSERLCTPTCRAQGGSGA